MYGRAVSGGNRRAPVRAPTWYDASIMQPRKLALLVSSLISILPACSDEPADLSGNYSANLTSRDNGCNLANWQPGAMVSQVPVVITQTGADASAEVGGLAGVALELALASRVFIGEVDGSSFRLKIIGTRPQTSGNCTFTYDATMTGSLSGDSLSGRVSYTTATNGNSDCAALRDCVSFQDFAASRPPR